MADERTAIVVPGHGAVELDGVHRISARCRRLVVEAERSRERRRRPTWSSSPAGRRPAARPRPSRCATAWRGPDVELVVEPTATDRPPRTPRGRCRCCSNAGSSARSSSARPSTRPRTRYFFVRSTRPAASKARVRVAPVASVAARARVGACGAAVGCRRSSAQRGPSSSGARDERHARLHPGLERGGEPARRCSTACAASCRTRTCSSSTTARPTARPRSRASTGARSAVARREPGSARRGRRRATAGRSSTATRSAGASTPTASIPAASSRACSTLVRERRVRRRGRLALRLGRRLRAVPLPPEPGRGGSAPRCCAARSRLVLRRPFGDATSGLYAVNAKALPLLAEPFTSGAPEVEALIRVVEAGLRLEEVPVDMAERAGGESKLRGRQGGEARPHGGGNARARAARPAQALGVRRSAGSRSSSSRS